MALGRLNPGKDENREYTRHMPFSGILNIFCRKVGAWL
jgi:hypothetical protein